MKTSFETKYEESLQLKAVKIAQLVTFLPEIQCTEDNIRKENCIDIKKLEATKEIMKEEELNYFDMFGFSKITLKQIFPSFEEWELYNKALSKFSTKFYTFIPVSLYNPISRLYSYGILSVEVYKK